MAEYLCKVADTTGRVYSHLEAAQSESEARQKLTDRGLFVYSVRASYGFGRLQTPNAGASRAVGSSDFLVFNQQFNTLIKAGLPILKSLDLLAERAASPRLRPLLDEVRKRVRDGALLSEAMEEQGVFPRIYTTSILAGEKSGSLTGVLDQYIAYQKISTTFRRRLLSALVYPTVLVCASTLILSFVIGYVIPRFADLFRELNVSLPWITLFLIEMATDLRPFLIGAVALVIGGGIGAAFWSRTEEGGIVLDRVKRRLPLVRDLWLKFQISQFARTLATLLTGGTPLVAALDTAGEAVGSRLISRAIRDAAVRVREGSTLHAGLAATDIVPALALEMIEVGEATGALAPMLNSVAEFYEEDVNLKLTTAVALIGPAVLVLVAIVVGFVLIALYYPIFTLSVGTAGR
ncbi:MAG: type II secretion system F family protein [Acidobacteria bacterium]|nr:type II secretion system F family protein [Acidobacteriota bacterium]